MKINLPLKTISGNFVIIDSSFPQKQPFGFRNTEINEYFKRLSCVEAFAMSPMEPWGDAWFPWSYGIEKLDFEQNKKGYVENYPVNEARVLYLEKNRRYRFKLAYSYFLAETYVLLPFLEKNKIPFIFMLYPGGTFGLENKASDAMLKRIMSSRYFKKVIVSQSVTREYLINKGFCEKEKIAYIYGGFAQFYKNEVKPKKFYKKDKETFDICFVAAKYSERGVDKGYDLFIDSARILAKEIPEVHFHVVGNFNEDDVPIKDLENKITFYGYQKKDFFPDFYARMDVFLSPNRPGKLYEGNFDGFPIGIDAGFCGTAMFVSDELDMNKSFTPDKDIVIVPLNAKKIASKIFNYYNDLDSLYELSKRCEVISQKLFSIDLQINGRIKVFNEIYENEYGKKLK